MASKKDKLTERLMHRHITELAAMVVIETREIRRLETTLKERRAAIRKTRASLAKLRKEAGL